MPRFGVLKLSGLLIGVGLLVGSHFGTAAEFFVGHRYVRARPSGKGFGGDVRSAGF